MDKTALKRMLEAVLFSATEPVSVDKLRQTLPEEWELTNKELKVILSEMHDAYHENSFRLIETASGYRFQIREEFAELVVKLMEEKPPRYSRALLETLVIIAYRQPVTRAEIEDVRGVAVSSSIIKTLLEREWIRVIGHRDVPGRPSIVGTTKQFLDYFNLQSLDDLPPLEAVKDLDKMAENFEQQLPLYLEQDEQATTEQATETSTQTEPQDFDQQTDEQGAEANAEAERQDFEQTTEEQGAEANAQTERHDFEQQTEEQGTEANAAKEVDYDFEIENVSAEPEAETPSITPPTDAAEDPTAESVTDPEPAEIF